VLIKNGLAKRRHGRSPRQSRLNIHLFLLHGLPRPCNDARASSAIDTQADTAANTPTGTAANTPADPATNPTTNPAATTTTYTANDDMADITTNDEANTNTADKAHDTGTNVHIFQGANSANPDTECDADDGGGDAGAAPSYIGNAYHGRRRR